MIQSDDDKRQIPLAQAKPIVLRPKLQNQAKGFDDLKLEPLLRDRLRQAGYSLVSGNASSGLVFVDTDEMPGAIVPSGNYVIEGGVVRLRINLLVDYNPAATIVVDGAKNDLNALVDQVLTAISAQSQKLRSP